MAYSTLSILQDAVTAVSLLLQNGLLGTGHPAGCYDADIEATAEWLSAIAHPAGCHDGGLTVPAEWPARQRASRRAARWQSKTPAGCLGYMVSIP